MDGWEDIDDGEGEPKRSVTGGVERGILVAANAIWAVVGLVLWVPQIVRVVLTTAVRVVHAALTRQPAETVRGPVRRVSRFYTQGFLRPKEQMAEGVYASRDLRLGRVIAEAIWAVIFYVLVFALTRPQGLAELTASVAGRLAVAGGVAWSAVESAATGLPESWQGLVALERGAVLVLVALFVLFFAGGWWLGRRR